MVRVNINELAQLSPREIKFSAFFTMTCSEVKGRRASEARQAAPSCKQRRPYAEPRISLDNTVRVSPASQRTQGMASLGTPYVVQLIDRFHDHAGQLHSIWIWRVIALAALGTRLHPDDDHAIPICIEDDPAPVVLADVALMLSIRPA